MLESERLLAMWGGLGTCSAVIKTWLAPKHSLVISKRQHGEQGESVHRLPHGSQPDNGWHWKDTVAWCIVIVEETVKKHIMCSGSFSLLGMSLLADTQAHTQLCFEMYVMSIQAIFVNAVLFSKYGVCTVCVHVCVHTCAGTLSYAVWLRFL